MTITKIRTIIATLAATFTVAVAIAPVTPDAHARPNDGRFAGSSEGLKAKTANCDNLKGKGGGGTSSGYRLLRVFDIFITEPSFDRPALGVSNKEIYAEIVGPAETGEGTSGFQYYAKNRPFLIR